MHYAIAIHKDADSDYGVSVPDLPGCISAGETLQDAIAMAQEAIELHLAGMIEEGAMPPEPTPVDQWSDDPDYAGAVWAVVRIEDSNLSLKSQRVQITLPERLLEAIDAFADRHDLTRSGLLARAASEFIGRAPITTQRGRYRPANTQGGKAKRKAVARKIGGAHLAPAAKKPTAKGKKAAKPGRTPATRAKKSTRRSK